MRRGMVVVSRSTPSTRKRTRISRPSGSKWMSEAPSSTAWAMIELTSLMTGASSADSRISVIVGAVFVLALLDRLGDRLVEPAHARRSALDVLRRGHDRAAPRARSSASGRRARSRSTGRPSQPAAGRSSSKPIGAALSRRRGLRAEQVQRREVDLEDAQVDVEEPEALGGRARQLVGVERRLLEQHLLGRAPARAALRRSPRRPARAWRSPARPSRPGSSATSPPRWGGVRPSTSDREPPSRRRATRYGAKRRPAVASSLIARPRPLA